MIVYGVKCCDGNNLLPIAVAEVAHVGAEMRRWIAMPSSVRTLARGLFGASLLVLAGFGAAEAAPVKNVVLVHGAWVDGSGWKAVYDILIRDGYSVTAVQIPETSLADDVAATKRVLAAQDGPTILVGHSYGGSVITEAGVEDHVVGLVYVAGSAPDVGENEHELEEKTPSVLGRTAGAILSLEGDYVYLKPSLFPDLFAGGLPLAEAQFEAHSQEPTQANCFSTNMTVAAWRTKPSWAVIPQDDKIISPTLEKFYYERAHSHMIVVDGASHSVYMTHPKEVAAQIEQAALHAVP